MTHPMRTVTKNPDDVEQLAEHPVSFGRVAALFRPHLGTIAIVVALIVATAGLTVVQPFLVRATVDTAIPQRDSRMLAWLVAGMVALTVVSQVLSLIHI